MPPTDPSSPGTRTRPLPDEAAIVARAAAGGRAVIPWGGGTGQEYGYLPRRADVVLEGFRPGIAARLGIGPDDAPETAVYCSITGFGQTGPERLGAGYDGKIQALSGIMSITGHAETGPTRAGFAVCDVLSGATAAFVLTASDSVPAQESNT